MNTIVQLSNCQIVKSICDFTISRFSMLERTFLPFSRSALKGALVPEGSQEGGVRGGLSYINLLIMKLYHYNPLLTSPY